MKNMIKNEVISMLLVVCLIGFIRCLGAAASTDSPTDPSVTKAEKPNIIFIMADDLGYGQLGCYGQEKIQTPHINQMAREGMLFTDFYAGNSVCAPSRCSLITGKHPGHAAARGNLEIGAWDSYLGQLPIPEDDSTLFDIAKQAGYATAAYGKWGLGRAESSGSPDRNGVDDFFGYNCQRHAHTYYPRYLEGNRGQKVWLEGNYGQDGGKQYSHDVIVEKTLSFIKENKDTNFFMYLPWTIPHGPMEVPDLGIYKDMDWGDRFVTEAAMITLMDKDVGRIIDLLKKLGLDENTIVFFTSDNGCHGGGSVEFFEGSGPLRGKKMDLYEGGIRVPMIVRWPGRIKAGSTSHHIGAFWDMMPTLADLVGMHCPAENTDGISFVPELLGKPQAEHDFLYWEFHGTDYDWTPKLSTKQTRLANQALRVGKWKAIRHNLIRHYKDVPVQFSPVELYNLEKDISESNDIASQYPEVVRMMRGLMKASHVPNEHFKIHTE